MQKASLRKVKAPSSYTQENEDILHFTLNGLLPSGHTLALTPLSEPSRSYFVIMTCPVCSVSNNLPPARCMS